MSEQLSTLRATSNVSACLPSVLCTGHRSCAGAGGRPRACAATVQLRSHPPHCMQCQTDWSRTMPDELEGAESHMADGTDPHQGCSKMVYFHKEELTLGMLRRRCSSRSSAWLHAVLWRSS